ncbi:MAG: cell envelope biogenesis protein TolA [Xanthobacteraceae bacterium]
MRTGIFISAVSHVVLVAFALLGTPKLFESVPLQTIEVDLVRAQEVEPEPPQEPEKKLPEKPAEWNPLPEASAAQAKPSVPEAASAPAKAKQPPMQQARAPQPPADPPRPTPQQSPDLPAQSPQQPWIFDPVNIPALMNLPNAPQSGFDSEATAAANLSADEKTAFKAHLKKCWKLPDGMSATQTTRVTLRIFLKRDGGLAAEPMLIEASASREGPLLMQAAIRSVKECQPFALPADRYREWKTLDVSFSPQEMAGG